MAETTVETPILQPEESIILSIIHSVWKQRCLSIIVELKIPELICSNDKASLSIEEIATRSGCKAWRQLYPVMRLLARVGIGEELNDKHFAKTKGLELLRRDKGPSLGHFVAYECSDEQFSALRFLPACVKNDKPAFVLDHGMTTFEYMNALEKLPYEKSKKFEGSSQYMIGSDERRRDFADNYATYSTYVTDVSTLSDVPGLVNVHTAFPWSKCRVLVDVGGSSGHFLASILKLPGCEHAKGFVVELPSIVEDARANYSQLGLESDRLEFLIHDITQSSQGSLHLEADTVIMKNFLIIFAKDNDLLASILHRCLGLLSSRGGRIIIIEFCCPDGGDIDQVVEINGQDFSSQSIQRLSIGTMYVQRKAEWIEKLNMAGNKLGLKLKQVYDTFHGGCTIFELSYEPGPDCTKGK